MHIALAVACLPALLLTAAPVPVSTPNTRPVGEKLPKGPPWHVAYRTAKREALRAGRPVFVYFTKTY